MSTVIAGREGKAAEDAIEAAEQAAASAAQAQAALDAMTAAYSDLVNQVTILRNDVAAVATEADFLRLSH